MVMNTLLNGHPHKVRPCQISLCAMSHCWAGVGGQREFWGCESQVPGGVGGRT